MKIIRNVRQDIEEIEYHSGIDFIYIRLQILRAINTLMGNRSTDTYRTFSTVRTLQMIYKEVPNYNVCSLDMFMYIKSKLVTALSDMDDNSKHVYLEAVA